MITQKLSTLAKNKLLTFFACFFLLDILSAFAYFVIPSRNIIFFLLVIVILLLAVYRLEYGFLVAAAELFSGSKGHLFFVEIDGNKISLRIAIFAVLFLAWFTQLSIKIARRQPIPSAFAKNTAFIAVLVLVIFQFIHGFGRGHGLKEVFFDANGYFYILLGIPLLQILQNKQSVKLLRTKLIEILYAAASWLSLKTLFIFIVFTYGNNSSYVRYLYLWIRNTVGEITPAGGNLFRIFIQSQIYIILAIIILISRKIFQTGKGNKYFYFIGPLYGAAILVSMSRSFWVGALAAIVCQLIISIAQAPNTSDASSVGFIFSRKYQKAFKALWAVTVIFAGGLMILSIIYFPSVSGIGKRTQGFISEAGASSRLAQFQPLMQEIVKRPFFGYGFGKAITYQSSDPRVLVQRADGLLTTYAFELGYLDMLLKLGVIGVIIYGFFIWKIARNLWRNREPLAHGMFFGIIALLVINMFSSYLNHPLGIGQILFVMIYSETS